MKMTTGTNFTKVTETAKKDLGEIFQKLTGAIAKKEVTPPQNDLKADSSVKAEHKMEKSVEQVDYTEMLNDMIESSSKLGSNVGSMQTDVSLLQTNVGSLQVNVESLHTDVESLSKDLISLHSEISRTGMAVTDCSRKIDKLEAKPVDLSGVMTEISKLSEDITQVKSVVDEYGNGDTTKFRQLNETIVEMDRSISKSMDSIKSDVSVMLRENNYFISGYKTKMNVLFAMNIVLILGVALVILQLM